jgi:hypothetical protein
VSRVRSSMVLLAICVGASLIGVLRLATEQNPLPPGSSYSAQPDGSLGLYTWIETVVGQPVRLRDRAIGAGVGTVIILQPTTLLDSQIRDSLDAVAQRGGTLVLAGDSIQWLLYARALGVSVEPVTPEVSRASAPDGLDLPFSGRYRLQAADAQPLLLRDNGDWVGLRRAYKQGTLIVLASPDPLTNAGLANASTARFVFRQVVAPSIGGAQAFAFDEIERLLEPGAPGPTTVNQLLFGTPVGRAVLYAALVTFAYLLLAGRRLGPPLVGRPAAESQRTMYEHVQMLANLYRRAGQLHVVRAAFSRHYARLLARGAVSSRRAPKYAEALARLKAAGTESDLVSAVARMHDPD